MFLCDGLCGFLTNVLLLITAVVAIHYVFLLSNFNYWKKRGVFSPNPTALFGDMPGQIDGKRHIKDDLDELYRRYKKSHSYIGIFQFRSPRFLVLDPALMNDFFIKYFKYFQGTEMFEKVDIKSDPLFGNHPFFLAGDEWKRRRQEVSPAFTNSRIKAVYPILENCFVEMQKFIKTQSAKSDFQGFDAKNLAARFTVSVVSNSIYNVDPKAFEDKESELLNRALAFLTPTKRFMFFSILWSIYPFLTKYIKFGFAQPEAEKFFIDLMGNSMKQREASGFKNLDYLDYLIQLKNKKEISDSDIAGHGASFLADGFDTSSSAISSALYELAKNKRVQDKLRQELAEKLPNDEDFTYDNIMAHEYLDHVWHETLRIWSPATHISRCCTEAVTVDLPKDKKVRFDPGDILYFPCLSIFHDPDYFEDPLEFKPERFEAESAKSMMERGVFFPFGMGPRICPGNRFAWAQGKFCIAALVKKFEISVNPRTPKKMDIHPQSLIVSVRDCYLDFKEIKKN